jgi:hypothetical protein
VSLVADTTAAYPAFEVAPCSTCGIGWTDEDGICDGAGCPGIGDHIRPHWCEHDGGPALVAPPAELFYVGAKWSDDKLETRDCPYVAAPAVVDVVATL